MEIFNRLALRQHLQRAHSLRLTQPTLFALGAEQLLDRLTDVKQTFPNILELGARSVDLQSVLVKQVGIYVATELVPSGNTQDIMRVIADEELIPFSANTFDLVVSNLALHWVNDLPGCLAQARYVLKPAGLFQAVLLGGQTLHELRDCLQEAEYQLTGGLRPRMAPMTDALAASQLLQRAGFSLPVADAETIHYEFSDCYALMRFLRAHAETNISAARPRHFSARQLFKLTADLYQSRYPAQTGQGITASFEYIFLHGWKT